MASLHESLHSLSPINFADVPQSPEKLDGWLKDLYAKVQVVLESIPIREPDEPHGRSRAQTWTSTASSASEISSSSARTEDPPTEYAQLQKEWGKPIKLKAHENTLGISVYKLSGNDGKGSWFARRSVHEGLGFARFRDAFEREFATSLAVQGPPGEGNIRGIGAEKKVEDIDVPHRGHVEVFQLSAQFPGPTTPRDFVTFLSTSTKGVTHYGQAAKVPELAPRTYMIVSKPCNHEKTQPRNGFIRGQYESVEFIREVPRKLKTSHSSTDLSQIEAHHRHEHNLEHDMLVKNAEKRTNTFTEDGTQSHTKQSAEVSREGSPAGRRRGHTVADPQSATHHHEHDDYDPEQNPVEWIMVTRSDPGGSVPRFLVDRGTPGSICADAVKFLNWACALKENQTPATPARPHEVYRRESYTAFEAEHGKTDSEQDSHTKSEDPTEKQLIDEKPIVPTEIASTSPVKATTAIPNDRHEDTMAGSGMMATVAGAMGAFAPQAILDHFAHTGNTDTPSNRPTEDGDRAIQESAAPATADDDLSVAHHDADSVSVSAASFASADSHLTSDNEDPSLTSQSLNASSNNVPDPNSHEHHLLKLNERKAAMTAKFEAHREKLTKDTNASEAKQQAAVNKAEEKHRKEMAKHEERYQKETKKIEERKEKEQKKLEAQKRKEEDKDEKLKLRRERDEANEKLKLMEQEKDLWMKQVGDLHKENTALMTRIAKYEEGNVDKIGHHNRVRSMTSMLGGDKLSGNRSRSSSLRPVSKDEAEMGNHHGAGESSLKQDVASVQS